MIVSSSDYNDPSLKIHKNIATRTQIHKYIALKYKYIATFLLIKTILEMMHLGLAFSKSKWWMLARLGSAMAQKGRKFGMHLEKFLKVVKTAREDYLAEQKCMQYVNFLGPRPLWEE